MTTPEGGRPRAWLSVALTAVLALAGCQAAPTASVETTSGASLPPVVRQVLAAGDPAAAPGERLELVRYTIQPGTALPAHHHPGMQLAYVESGTLTYNVIEGEVTITSADGAPRKVGPGETATVVAGEWLVETEDIVHFGENGGPDPLVILAASLLEAGQPAAIPVSPSPSPSLRVGPSPVEPGVGSPPPSS